MTPLLLAVAAAGLLGRAAAVDTTPAPVTLPMALPELRPLPAVAVRVDEQPAQLALNTWEFHAALRPDAGVRLLGEPAPGRSDTGRGPVSVTRASIAAGAGGPPLGEAAFEMRDLRVLYAEGLVPSGILGMEFLSRHAVALDWAAGTLTFYPGGCLAGTRHEPQDAVAVPLRLDDSLRPTVRVLLGGRPVDMELALHWKANLVRTRRSPASLGAVATARVRRVDGDDGALHRLEELRLGAARWERPVVASHPGADTDRLGLAFLTRYRPLLDFPGRRLYLRPLPEPPIDPHDRPRLGLIPARAADGTVRVAELTQPSPASEAGIALQDELIAVAGIRLRGLPAERLFAAYRAVEQAIRESEAIEVTVRSTRDGAERSFTLRPRLLP